MTTEPQEPLDLLGALQRSMQRHDKRPAAPVAQEPPAPTCKPPGHHIAFGQHVCECGMVGCCGELENACGTCGSTDEGHHAHDFAPAPGSAQEPADSRLHDELCDYFAGEDCNCGTWAQEPADPPWLHEAVRALFEHEMGRLLLGEHYRLSWSELSESAKAGRTADLRAALPGIRAGIEQEWRAEMDSCPGCGAPDYHVNGECSR